MSAPSNGRSNGHFMYDDFSGNKKSKQIRENHFLWWCAGAHQNLLKDYPSEYAKYAGLGGVILATFLLASLSAGYALYSVFGSLAWATGFGILWGLIIFNLDRLLVSTMRKYGVSKSKQLVMTIPRILLAILISVTIARPLELKIFEKEIDVKVAENQHKKTLLNDSLLAQENKAELEALHAQRTKLVDRRKALEDTLSQLRQSYIQEADGTGGSRQRGIEKLTNLKFDAYQAALSRYSPEWQHLGEQIAQQDSILQASSITTSQKSRQYAAGLSGQVGFLERNRALSDLSREEPSVFWAIFFISLLVIAIETGPILSKQIMHVGPYDLALAKSELIAMAESENHMQRHKHLEFERLQEWFGKKKETTSTLIQKLTDLQSKHIDLEIERWERGEADSSNKAPLRDLLKRIQDQYEISEDSL